MQTTKHWKGLPEGFQVRPTKFIDVEEAVDLYNASSMVMIGCNDFENQELRNDWQTPNFDLGNCSRVIHDQNQRMVAITEVWDITDPPVHPILFGRVHPDYEGMGLGSELLTWSIDRAAGAMQRVPEEARISVRAFAVNNYDPSKELLEDHGFRKFRSSWQMTIDLGKPIPEPAWPEGIYLQPYVHERDGVAVFQADREAFRDHWGFLEEPFDHGYERWLYSMNGDEEYDPELWFIAMKGNEIAGAALCRRKSWESKDAGWVRSLFVRRPYRRQGLALTLLHHSFREFRKRGKREVCLGVDSQNLTGATHLYEKAGMQIKRKTDHYEYELRSGKELSKT
jgi:mycothiol synthase